MKKKVSINATSVCKMQIQAIHDAMSILSGKWKFRTYDRESKVGSFVTKPTGLRLGFENREPVLTYLLEVISSHGWKYEVKADVPLVFATITATAPWSVLVCRTNKCDRFLWAFLVLASRLLQTWAACPFYERTKYWSRRSYQESQLIGTSS